jgi:hypothetical protein
MFATLRVMIAVTTRIIASAIIARPTVLAIVSMPMVMSMTAFAVISMFSRARAPLARLPLTARSVVFIFYFHGVHEREVTGYLSFWLSSVVPHRPACCTVTPIFAIHVRFAFHSQRFSRRWAEHL